MIIPFRGVGRHFSRGGGRFKCSFFPFFKKDLFCTDLFPNTLHWKCIRFAPPPPKKKSLPFIYSTLVKTKYTVVGIRTGSWMSQGNALNVEYRLAVTESPSVSILVRMRHNRNHNGGA